MNLQMEISDGLFDDIDNVIDDNMMTDLPNFVCNSIRYSHSGKNISIEAKLSKLQYLSQPCSGS